MWRGFQFSALALILLGVMYVIGHALLYRFDFSPYHAQYAYDRGSYFKYGSPDPNRGELSREWFKVAANKGVPDAQFLVGEIYYDGRFETQDYNAAAQWFRKAADAGHPFAAMFLGGMYRDGKGVEQDYTEAMKLYLRSVEKGNWYSKCQIGELYFQGQGVKKDEREASKWWGIPQEKFDTLNGQARAGNSDAQFQLGGMYRGCICSGLRVVSDIAKGLLESSARQGNLAASKLLLEQLSRRQDATSSEIAKLIFEIADRGDAAEQVKAGNFYRDGVNVKKDIKQAEKWYRRAADQGSITAQESLGFLYLQDEQDFKRNEPEAYFWLALAAKSGSASFNAMSAKEEIAKQLSPDVLAKVEQRIEKWVMGSNGSKTGSKGSQ